MPFDELEAEFINIVYHDKIKDHLPNLSVNMLINLLWSFCKLDHIV